MSARAFSRFRFFPVFILIIFSCAVQGSPTGGPVDRTPPVVTETVPADSTTRVPRDTKIHVVFSEAVSKESLSKAIFVSPDPHVETGITIGNDNFDISFAEPLAADQTYVISVGTSAQDLRGNVLPETFFISFSTGESLDRGAVSGRIYTADTNNSTSGAQNPLIRAYRLGDEPEASPLYARGDYITQADNEGKFLLPHLSRGIYRIFAVTNSDEDYLFSLFRDQIALPSRDVVVTDEGKISYLSLMPVTVDTLQPHLRLLENPDRSHIRLHFSKALDPSSISERNFSITASGKSVPGAISSVYYTSSADNVVSLYTDVLIPGQTYQLAIEHLANVSGGQMTGFYDSTTVFTLSSAEDTTGFSLLSLTPADSSEGVPLYSSVTMIFNQAVETGLLSSHFFLLDSLRRHVSGKMRAVSPSEYVFLPDTLLQTLMKYTIVVQSDSIQSVEGKTLREHPASTVFRTMDVNLTGSLLGTVVQSGGTIRHPVVLELRSVGVQNSQPVILRLDSAGTYEFQGLLSGEYALRAFLDRDRNGVWSPGRLMPFEHSEPFDYYPESLSVRQGIENFGINLTLYDR